MVNLLSYLSQTNNQNPKQPDPDAPTYRDLFASFSDTGGAPQDPCIKLQKNCNDESAESFGTPPSNLMEMEDRVNAWVEHIHQATGIKTCLIRRDLVYQNKYRGRNASRDLCTDLLSAFQGEPSPLLSHFTVKEQALLTVAFKGLSWPVSTPQTSIDQGASTKVQPRAVSGESGGHLTRDWICKQVQEAKLDRMLAKALSQTFKQESYDEMLSLTGLWLAYWSNKGTFDSLIAERGEVPFGMLLSYLRQKHLGALEIDGGDAIGRMYGRRTQTEVKNNKRLKRSLNEMCDASQMLRGDEPTIFFHKHEESENRNGFDVVDAEASAEHQLITHAMIQENRALINATYRGATDRYTRIYDALASGMTRKDIAEQEDISDHRASQMATKVRNTLREGQTTRKVATQILKLVAEEPFSTRSEIQSQLRIDCSTFRAASTYLTELGLLKEAKGESFALTSQTKSNIIL